ncbi:radial spoke head protein 4 homolog A [Rhagoletis pomonella]|uniref:radial spoke head protein 4 homolog A n=1 Tax=Rhagoletis pomonella TaxID=28610 RepID=UPI0017823F11|nr:radial spoke head protein 4 homolog A [Rhagoletis pomonella]
MELDQQQSCDGFTMDTTSSSNINFPCGRFMGKVEKPGKTDKSDEAENPCAPIFSTSTSSSSSNTLLSQYFDAECQKHDHTRKEPPNIGYELNVAKAIMQKYSSISGDNLFDHLSDIIKRVIDERPPNVIDFFEEFSRNVREQKLHLPERFPPDGVFEESRLYRVAKKMLLSMKLPVYDSNELPLAAEAIPSEESKSTILGGLKLDILDMSRFVTFNERVQHLQFFWNQCGFGINPDDIFQLACSMDRLQMHPSIMQCRFWGMMNGLKASYYVVEASLSHEEVLSRAEQMTEELQEYNKAMMARMLSPEQPVPTFVGPELTPGNMGWDDHPIEDLEKMVPVVAPIPIVAVKEVFAIPPEIVGTGTNRFSYFVVNSVSDDWIELPMVTPKQINASRQIKKFLTGDLEADIVSYPCFPGKEKHYLRALIGRITAGTYIAPNGYYRKMTKKEKRAFDGFEDDEEEEEEDDEPNDLGEGEEEEIDNDVTLLKNEKYEPEQLEYLTNLEKWLHVRPNLLLQGRVVWFDELKAKKERDKILEGLRKQMRTEEMGEEEEDLEQEEEDEDVDEDEEGEELSSPEVGPPILNPIYFDISDQYTMPWVTRFTSKYTNKNERILVMQSNIWPGAYTFTYDKLCESIYIGWGHKYVARNMPFVHLAPVMDEYPHGEADFIETTDPTPEEEEAYRLSLLKKQKKVGDGEHLSEYDEEYLADTSTDDDDDDDV